jgi:hypothetical protein
MTPEEQAEWEFLIDWFWPSGLDVKAKYRDLDDLKSSYDYRIYENFLRIQRKAIPKPRFGFIYLLGSEMGWYKIGLTKNLPARMKSFGLKLPFTVELLHYFPTDDTLKAENELHSLFANKRVNGEWFSLDPKDIETIKKIVERFFYSQE